MRTRLWSLINLSDQATCLQAPVTTQCSTTPRIHTWRTTPEASQWTRTSATSLPHPCSTPQRFSTTSSPRNRVMHRRSTRRPRSEPLTLPCLWSHLPRLHHHRSPQEGPPVQGTMTKKWGPILHLCALQDEVRSPFVDSVNRQKKFRAYYFDTDTWNSQKNHSFTPPTVW